MNAPEQRLTAAVRTLLDNHRPAGIPDGFQIRVEQDVAKLERPYIVISAADGVAPHPSARKLLLILTTFRRADDPATGPGEELHQKFVNALESNIDELATALAAAQLRVLKMPPGTTSETIVDGRADSSTASWTVWLQIL